MLGAKPTAAARRAITAPDCEITVPGVGGIDRETLWSVWLPAYKRAFPGLSHEAIDVVEAGDRVAVRLRITLPHTGTFATTQGEMGATGRTVVLDSVDVVSEADGRITGWHSYFDQMSLLGQLGLLSAASGA